MSNNWDYKSIAGLFEERFNDILYRAHLVHRENFNPNEVQQSALLSIKTGNCAEDCAYCPQSVHYNTDIEKENLMPTEQIVAAAKQAQEQGASRFCMGLAWRSPPTKTQFGKIIENIKAVKNTGIETCLTMGMINDEQAQELKQAGLDYYNHNLDTSEEYYKKIITTRTYQDRLDTLTSVAKANLKTCCGGIVGMGESRDDRINFLLTLAKLDPQPDSVPINLLVKVKGTPLENAAGIDKFEFIRTIAIARILLPKSMVRLSAGRQGMSDEMQALCFFAGANSIFYGDKLLTTENNCIKRDQELFNTLGIKALNNNAAKNSTTVSQA
jgi:biotin synthase